MSNPTHISSIRAAREKGRPMLAVLIDPGKTDRAGMEALLQKASSCAVDFFFVGGSTSRPAEFAETVHLLKALQNVPVILFPGNELHISSEADGLLLLSLISGRNPELLIGKHVAAANALVRSGLEIIPTGYLLVESGRLTSVAYMSHTLPVPRDKSDIAVATALAGQLLGMQLIYLEAGSGAEWPVPAEMIKAVRARLDVPLIVGGGITTVEHFKTALTAGADLVVVGNALEKNPAFLSDLSDCLLEHIREGSRFFGKEQSRD
jgi:phosphoglycerol geranylgeranyltransferase